MSRMLRKRSGSGKVYLPSFLATRLRTLQLLRVVWKYRVIKQLSRFHDWVADHFLGVVIIVCLGVITPIGLVCVIFGLPVLIEQALLMLFFMFLGVLILFGGRDHYNAQAASKAETEYKRYLFRRRHLGVRHIPEGLIDDLYPYER